MKKMLLIVAFLWACEKPTEKVKPIKVEEAEFCHYIKTNNPFVVNVERLYHKKLNKSICWLHYNSDRVLIDCEWVDVCKEAE